MCLLLSAKKNCLIETDLVSTKNVLVENTISYCFCLFDLILYVPVNNFSVMYDVGMVLPELNQC